MKYLFMIITLLAGVVLFAQPAKEEIKKHRIRKTTVIKDYGSAAYESVYWYDRKGDDSLQKTGDKINVITYAYKNGKLLAVIHTGQDGKKGDMYEYAYNQDGSYKITRTDGEFGMKSYEWYSSKGRLIKSQSPDGNTVTYKYDAQNRLTHVTSDGKNDGIIVNRRHFYNTKGQRIKTEDGQNEDKTTTTYLYDAKGKLVKQAETNNSTEYPVSASYEYQYNEKGLLLQFTEKRKYGTEEESVVTTRYSYEYF